MNIYLISDTHFFHTNMLLYCDRPENFNDLIIKNWNKLIKPEDIVIHLGDVIMNSNSAEKLPSIIATLPGKKILCRGNHDTEKKWGTQMGFLERGFDFVMDYFVYDKYVFSHCPITPLPNQANQNWNKQVELNIHGHFHNKFPTNPNFKNDFYDVKYYLENKEKYHLIQIEDTLSPIPLEKVIGEQQSKKGGEKI